MKPVILNNNRWRVVSIHLFYGMVGNGVGTDRIVVEGKRSTIKKKDWLKVRNGRTNSIGI